MRDGPETGRPTLAALNAAPAEAFARALDGVLEHAPWVAERAAEARPFADVGALHGALMAVLRDLPETARLRFLNGHPELTAGALPADMTAASRDEQGGAGLGGAAGVEELPRWNAAYRARHGIPFIICLRRHTGPDVLRALRRRLDNPVEAERAAALEEVGHVSRLRLAARLAGPDAGPPRGALILTVEGDRPTLVLEQEGTVIGTWPAGVAGNAPLLAGEALRIGNYVLRPGAEPALPFRVEDPARDLVLHLRRGAAGWVLHGD